MLQGQQGTTWPDTFFQRPCLLDNSGCLSLSFRHLPSYPDIVGQNLISRPVTPFSSVPSSSSVLPYALPKDSICLGLYLSLQARDGILTKTLQEIVLSRTKHTTNPSGYNTEARTKIIVV